MTNRPGLLLHVPGDWDVVPDALIELRRHLSDEYGATLEVRPATGYIATPMPQYTGEWSHIVVNEIRSLIHAAFFTLDWLDLEDVG
ncbi:hypothetical protein E7T09_20475 [Deinococcus sp. KSM4-11]|uniref:hypothetical protein n=1 Tax=Deinococcus sp. KSM4-11 TaxID=2568654 RepID=UPI0010A2D506|nr:hypothetical protein [Deinococcus sp. KSM4-11]THF84380.1 hypothetical protein E7T09_20475 [Deinococcus sp. KSM4-11]